MLTFRHKVVHLAHIVTVFCHQAASPVAPTGKRDHDKGSRVSKRCQNKHSLLALSPISKKGKRVTKVSKNVGCYFCDAPHMVRNCPKKEFFKSMLEFEEGSETNGISLPGTSSSMMKGNEE